MEITKTFKGMTKKRQIIFLVFLVLSIVCACMIFGFSSDNAEQSSQTSGRVTRFIIGIFEPGFEQMNQAEQEELVIQYHKTVRKGAHVCIYTLLGFLTYFCVGSVKFLPQGLFKQAIVSVPFCVFFAMTDEFHQLFVDQRSGQWSDVGIDSCGVLLGTFIAVCVSFFLKLNLNKKA